MEERATYGVDPIRPETLRAFAEGWEQPTPDEVKAILKKANLTGGFSRHLT